MTLKLFPTTIEEAKAVLEKAYGQPFVEIEDPIEPELLLREEQVIMNAGRRY